MNWRSILRSIVRSIVRSILRSICKLSRMSRRSRRRRRSRWWLGNIYLLCNMYMLNIHLLLFNRLLMMSNRHFGCLINFLLLKTTWTIFFAAFSTIANKADTARQNKISQKSYPTYYSPKNVFKGYLTVGTTIVITIVYSQVI